MKTFTSLLGLLTAVCAIAADVTGDRADIGQNHVLNGTLSSITGGSYNTNDDGHSIIAGGHGNRIYQGSNAFNAILGGRFNYIQSNSYSSVIAGGEDNWIGTNSQASSISGGINCRIKDASPASWIGGGGFNYIEDNSSYGTIGGGSGNGIEQRSRWSTIAGGGGNLIGSLFTFTNGTANSSFIGGGWFNKIGNESSDCVLAGGRANLISSNSPFSSIGGGAENCIVTNTHFAVIAGGIHNTNYGFVGTIGGGFWNQARGDYSTIGGGYQNTNSAAADYSTVGGGRENFATGQFSTIPGGHRALATHYGQFAYASGYFGTWGDAQHSIHVLRRLTDSTNQTELFLDGGEQLGSGVTNRMTISSGSTWVFEIQVVGRRQGGTEKAGYLIKGVIDNTGGTTTFIGTPTVTSLGESILPENAGTWGVSVAAQHNALCVTVRGSNSYILWVATVKTTETVL